MCELLFQHQRGKMKFLYIISVLFLSINSVFSADISYEEYMRENIIKELEKIYIDKILSLGLGNIAQEVINIMELACDYGDFTGCLEVTKSYKQMLEYRELQAEINNTPLNNDRQLKLEILIEQNELSEQIIIANFLPNLSEIKPIKLCPRKPPTIAQTIKYETAFALNPCKRINTEDIEKNPLISIPAIKLVARANGAISKTFGSEIGVFFGNNGSLIRIKYNGIVENIIKHALSTNTLFVDRFKAMIKTPIPEAI